MLTKNSRIRKLAKGEERFRYIFFTALIAILFFTSYAHAEKFPILKKVAPPEVCMITNRHMAAPQIAVPIGKKVYYGCCEMCVGTLNKDVKSRYALDPLTGKKVDKATAVIGAKKDGAVIYFENQKNFDVYLKKSDKSSN
ncbi:MAG: hypothetical protein RQ824_04405 [bacterium]|nr:hypothetical protein [bacterium]